MAGRMLLLKAGVTRSRERLGDYEAWFARASGAEVTAVEVHLGHWPPPQGDFDVVVMSGSPSSVTRLEPWMERAADFLAEQVEQKRWVLGVCFGHQLLAWRFGAKVEQHPRGRELGTLPVTRTALADPLFDVLPPTFEVQQTHEDHVVDVPAAISVLATNAHAPCQAFRVGAHGYGVQFHPEMDAASVQYVIDLDASPLRARDSEAGTVLLRRLMHLATQ